MNDLDSILNLSLSYNLKMRFFHINSSFKIQRIFLSFHFRLSKPEMVKRPLKNALVCKTLLSNYLSKFLLSKKLYGLVQDGPLFLSKERILSLIFKL